jgi:TetR/AcrR family transcriptional regulator
MSEPSANPPSETPAPSARRPRAKPGERRMQVLQALADMLQQPAGEKITTAALAKRLQVSEAALYRHFASKAQMLEGLLDFIEDSLLGLAHQVQARETQPQRRCARMAQLILEFAATNPGMARVMVGDALLHEHERLQARVTLMFDKLEALMRQEWRDHAQAQRHPSPTAEANLRSAGLMAWVQGRLLRFCRSGFKRSPVEGVDETLRWLVDGLGDASGGAA